MLEDQDIVPLWKGLTRQLDSENIVELCSDTKVSTGDKPNYYVPTEHLEAARVMFPHVNVIEYTGQKIKDHGLLSLAWEDEKPLAYAVPGGRFNEMYGWDSYFIGLGLLQSGFVDLAANLVKHQCFQIEHYGKILNANRSYFLNRSQPPFLTDLALQVHKANNDAELLQYAIKTAIKEYDTIWNCEPRLDKATGLAKYSPPSTHQIPPEVEKGHFDEAIEPFARASSLSLEEYTAKYNAGVVDSKELDEYFLHDLGVRESGHDTSVRLIGKCAHLACIDLNCLLYKYESDIADVAARFPSAADEKVWRQRADARKAAINKYLWNEKEGLYYDYNVASQAQEHFVSATTLWALWARVASEEQAKRLVENLDKLEHAGGIAGTGEIDGKCQWDCPAGWAPHQIMAWEGLKHYGYKQDASRLASKWRKMVQAVHEDQGLIFEKYNVKKCSHGVDVEYGNQGTYNEGFGWTNASFVLSSKFI